MTVPQHFGDAIRAELYSGEQRESVERIKDLVAASLRTADPAIELHRTTHFNHSFTPDFVARWTSSGDRQDRRIFLRPTQVAEELREDVELVGGDDAMFVALDAWFPDQAQPLLRLDTAARGREAFVTRIEAVDAVVASRSERPGIGILAAAIVRHGHGLLEAAQAEQTTAAVAAGFEGAQTADTEATRTGVTALGGALQRSEASRVTNVMQAVWTASGSSAASFPAEVQELAGKVSPEALRFLLTFEAVEDVAFWRRLARGVDFETLLEIDNIPESIGFQRFMTAAITRLRSRACTVQPISQKLGSGDDLTWSLADRALRLRGATFEATTTWSKKDLPRVALPDNSVLPVAQLRARTLRAEINVGEVELSDGGNAVTLRSEVGPNVFDSASPEVARLIGGKLSARKAVASIEQHSLALSFENNTAVVAGPRSQPYAADVLHTSINLLVDLVDSQRSALAAVLFPPSERDYDDEDLEISEHIEIYEDDDEEGNYEKL